MKVRHSANVAVDDVTLIEARGVVLHPDLLEALHKELLELEHKGKISRLPSTILEHYHIMIEERFAMFEDSCRRRQNMI